MFKKKKNDDGEVVKHKARLVARGFNQEPGIDYGATWAPTLKGKSLRLGLALSARPSRRLAQLDIKTAFLNADVHEDIYVYAPAGMDVGDDEVLKLNKALYGIKQAPYEWNTNINNYFLYLGFRQCKKDPCIYVKNSKHNHIIMLALFVDDIVCSYDVQDESEWQLLKSAMKQQYELTDIGSVNHILGMRVTRCDDSSIRIVQDAYIKQKLAEYGMTECKEAATPGDVNVQLNDESESGCQPVSQHRRFSAVRVDLHTP